eukprot:SAG25_NODE_1516_length_2857_cov_14.361131_3_plen_164_part_00
MDSTPLDGSTWTEATQVVCVFPVWIYPGSGAAPPADTAAAAPSSDNSASAKVRNAGSRGRAGVVATRRVKQEKPQPVAPVIELLSSSDEEEQAPDPEGQEEGDGGDLAAAIALSMQPPHKVLNGKLAAAAAVAAAPAAASSNQPVLMAPLRGVVCCHLSWPID